jgi:hypothetical protein
VLVLPHQRFVFPASCTDFSPALVFFGTLICFSGLALVRILFFSSENRACLYPAASGICFDFLLFLLALCGGKTGQALCLLPVQDSRSVSSSLCWLLVLVPGGSICFGFSRSIFPRSGQGDVSWSFLDQLASSCALVIFLPVHRVTCRSLESGDFLWSPFSCAARATVLGLDLEHQQCQAHRQIRFVAARFVSSRASDFHLV